jgi:hypothetical protein
MNPEPESSEAKGSFGFWLWPLLLLAGYVLSIGPAALVHKQFKNSPVQKTIEIVYAPVVFLIEKTPLRSPLIWWVSLWVGKVPV